MGRVIFSFQGKSLGHHWGIGSQGKAGRVYIAEMYYRGMGVPWAGSREGREMYCFWVHSRRIVRV